MSTPAEDVAPLAAQIDLVVKMLTDKDSRVTTAEAKVSKLSADLATAKDDMAAQETAYKAAIADLTAKLQVFTTPAPAVQPAPVGPAPAPSA